MSASNPFAPPRPAGPRTRPPRRAPDHPPVVRRLHRLGLPMPRGIQAEIYRRWAAMSGEERIESTDAEAALSDDELREEWAELLEEIKEAGGDPSTVRADG